MAQASGQGWLVKEEPENYPYEQLVRDGKADPFFASFALVRMGRLSVMPVSDAEWARLEKMGGG